MHRAALAAFALIAFAALAARGEEASTTAPAYWGKPSVDGGKCCQSLGEVRDNIDRIDRELIRAMAERGKYVHEAARFKKNPDAVDDPKRVEQVVAKARRLAEEDGLSPDVAEAAYRAMVAAFTRWEQEVYRREAH